MNKMKTASILKGLLLPLGAVGLVTFAFMTPNMFFTFLVALLVTLVLLGLWLVGYIMFEDLNDTE